MSVDLGLSPDQEAIAELFDGFFAKESPTSVARAAEPLGFDRMLWDKIVELGAPGMGSPVEVGGGGASLGDLVVLAESFGRAIAPVPLLDHLAALAVLDDVDLVAGEAIAAVALHPTAPDGRWHMVPAGAVADVVLGVDGDELVAVRSDAPMAGLRNLGSMPMADRASGEGERRVVGPASAFAAVLDRWKLLTAAAQTGIADAALALAVQYVTERHQFGVPIGSFQSVQHGLADLPIAVDGSRLLTHKAAWALSTPGSGAIDWRHNDITDGPTLASMAWLFATEAALMATDRSLHYHGGYGFAEEYDIQMYYRRARGWSYVLGDPSQECLDLSETLFAGGR